MSYTPPVGNASTTKKGIVRLSGDLSGTADTPTVPALSDKADISSLSAVATTGNYADLTNKPTFTSTDGSATQQVVHVSKLGKDTNDGQTWGTAYLTVAKAISVMGGGGLIYIGEGTFTESSLIPPDSTMFRGVGNFRTIIRLDTNGATLLNMQDKLHVSFYDICFEHSAAVTNGVLASIDNAFNCHFINVAFRGTWNATTPAAGLGQVGVRMVNNAGDNFFDHCHFESLGVGVHTLSVANFMSNCRLCRCGYHILGGVADGSQALGGVHCVNCVFIDEGLSYINIEGRSAQWLFTQCWFDGLANKGIICGNDAYGPMLLSLENIGYLAGKSISLEINAADRVVMQDVMFGDAGSHPTDVRISANKAVSGIAISVRSLGWPELSQSVWPSSWTVLSHTYSQVPGTLQAATAKVSSPGGVYAFANNASISSGAGAPAHAAVTGSLYLRTDNTATTGQRLYICTADNTADSAAWTALGV